MNGSFAIPDRLGARGLLLASRPVSWINTGLPFLAAAFDETRALTPVVLLGTLYFLVPYNLLLYGVNDLFDYASDIRNPRKQSLEGGLVAPPQAGRLWAAILATNLPFLALLAWLGGPVAALVLTVTVAVAVVYSAPPLRTKERPFLDSTTSALHFVLPAVCGFLVAGRPPEAIPWVILAGFLAWGAASHAIGAIQDVAYDRAAGIGSIATILGATRTAVVALLGYAVAVAATLTLPGPWGPIAALALAPYLLLPTMVLARPDEPQARRAWRSFMGLNLPVGFVLTQALLRHWGVTTFDVWELAAWTSGGAAGWVLVNTVLTRWATRRRGPAASPARALPSLTILVPCRDEATRLPAALRAIRAQRYPGELRVLVVDDGSTDGSADVATAELGPLGERAAVRSAPPKPGDWAGKGWAVRTGVDLADTELVLALDADTVLEPDGAATLVGELVATGADLVSGVTRYAMPTRPERAAMPGYPLLLFGFVPVWASVLTGGRLSPVAFAYGPVQLVRREAYLATGGHGAVPGSNREDLDLARAFARAGRRVHTTHAADLGATRHYETAREVLASWRRILPGYTGGSVAIALMTLVGELLAYGVPLVLPVAAWFGAPDRLPMMLAPLAALLAARLALALTQGQPLSTVLLHPVTVVVTLAAQALATADLVGGRVPAWRGRPMPDPSVAAPRPNASATNEIARGAPERGPEPADDRQPTGAHQ